MPVDLKLNNQNLVTSFLVVNKLAVIFFITYQTENKNDKAFPPHLRQGLASHDCRSGKRVLAMALSK